MNHSKDILDQEKQSIDVNKYKHPNGTLATTFHKPSGGETLYVQFVYTSQKICNHIWRKVSGSMSSDTINAKKQFTNQQS